MIVNSYQSDAFPTPDLLSPATSGFLQNPNITPYQCATFQHGIIRRNVGEEEADPVLEIVMEYAGALGVIVFDESCCLHDLTKAQVERNQFAMDMVVDCLDQKIGKVDKRANEASKRLSALEGKVTDMEDGYRELLALGWYLDPFFVTN